MADPSSFSTRSFDSLHFSETALGSQPQLKTPLCEKEPDEGEKYTQGPPFSGGSLCVMLHGVWTAVLQIMLLLLIFGVRSRLFGQASSTLIYR